MYSSQAGIYQLNTYYSGSVYMGNKHQDGSPNMKLQSTFLNYTPIILQSIACFTNLIIGRINLFSTCLKLLTIRHNVNSDLALSPLPGVDVFHASSQVHSVLEELVRSTCCRIFWALAGCRDTFRFPEHRYCFCLGQIWKKYHYSTDTLCFLLKFKVRCIS